MYSAVPRLLVSCTILFSSATLAAVQQISSMSITGGSMTEQGAGLYPTLVYIGPNTDLTSGYIGSGGAATGPMDYAPDSLMVFSLNGFTASIYSAPTNLGDLYSPAGSIPGGPVPTGVIDTMAGTLTLDVRSLYVNLSDTDLNIAPWESPDKVTGSWDSSTGAYSLQWSFYMPGGGFGYTWDFELIGVATAVPEPSTHLLWVAGLALLVARTHAKLSAGHKTRFTTQRTIPG